MECIRYIVRTVFQKAWEIATSIFIVTARQPFFEFYKQGPKAFGCWGGDKFEDICSKVTGVDSTHWVIHFHKCNEIIERQFTSVFFGIWFVLLAYSVYVLL